MATFLRAHGKQFLYLAGVLAGAVFVLVYRGPGWPFVRGYMGDWLIVQFIYVIARFGLAIRWRFPLAIAIFLFAVSIEIIQLLSQGTIPRNFAAEVTIGSTFDIGDIMAYALGLVAVLFTERYWKPRDGSSVR